MPLKEKYRKIKAEMQKKYGLDKGEKIFWAWVNKEGLSPDVKSYFFLSEELKAISEDVVEGSIATGHPDSYNDILTEDCLEDMVGQLKALPITIDDNHESFKNVSEEEKFRSFNPLAKVTDAKLDGLKVRVKCVLNRAHKRYEEIKASIKNKFLHSFSFAYIPVDWKSKKIDGEEYRVLNKVRLLNGCFTGIPVNPEATFSNVMLKSLVESSEYDFKEVEEIVRGVNEMSDKEKIKVEEAPKVDDSAESTPEKAPVEAEAEVKALKEEVKDLSDKVSSLEAAKKAVDSESKKDDEEMDDEEVKKEKLAKKDEVKALKEEVAELKAKLAEPQMKARVEPVKVDAVAEVKSRGPVDFIQ